MAEEKPAILPKTTRKVTEEDKEAAAEELVPHLQNLDKRQVARLKQIFGEKHALNPTQVEMIILEVKRRAFLRRTSEE